MLFYIIFTSSTLWAITLIRKAGYSRIKFAASSEWHRSKASTAATTAGCMFFTTGSVLHIHSYIHIYIHTCICICLYYITHPSQHQPRAAFPYVTETGSCLHESERILPLCRADWDVAHSLRRNVASSLCFIELKVAHL